MDEELDDELDEVRFWTVAAALWANASPEAREVGERCPGLHSRPEGDEIELFVVDRDDDNREVTVGWCRWDDVRRLTPEETLARLDHQTWTYARLRRIARLGEDVVGIGWPHDPPEVFKVLALDVIERLSAFAVEWYGEPMTLDTLGRISNDLSDEGLNDEAAGAMLVWRWVREQLRPRDVTS